MKTVTLTPPVYEVPIGRPRKKRSRSMLEADDEVEKDAKLTRKYRSVVCSVCQNIGHNARTCKGQRAQTQQQLELIKHKANINLEVNKLEVKAKVVVA
ncbi:hypothetical protein R6Q59_009191 [Mikania micrantha]